MRNSTKNCSKRKGDKSSKTLADVNGDAESGKGFYACYLLTSLSPRHKGQTYIGFTVNPKRRIRQHNGEITSGATRTKKKRPWEMTLCIYGFPTQVAALQFEWAWQHPTESLAVRKAACNLKSLNGLANKIKVAFTMLTLHTWQSMDLTVNFFSTKYMNHVAACPSLPKQMKVQFGSIDDLPCYSLGNQSLPNDDDDWDLDPQECNSSDGIEELTGGNSADANASASSTENQADKESRQSQECDVLEPRDPFFLVEDDDFQNRFNSSDGIEDLTTGNLVDGIRHSFDANASACTIENQTDKDSRQHQEYNVLEPRDPFFLVEDDGFRNCIGQEFNTRVCAEKSSTTRTASMEIEDSRCNQARPSEDSTPMPKGAIDETRSSNVRQIEVIDLFTPSPDCRDNTHGKKRKVDSSHTEIIDLTRSPDFIQL